MRKTNAIIYVRIYIYVYISKQDANKALFGQLERDFEDPGVSKPRGWSLQHIGRAHSFRTFDRGASRQSFSIYSRESPRKPNTGSNLEWHGALTGGQHPLLRISKLNPPYQTRFI